jgi:hypothetical protein
MSLSSLWVDSDPISGDYWSDYPIADASHPIADTMKQDRAIDFSKTFFFLKQWFSRFHGIPQFM